MKKTSMEIREEVIPHQKTPEVKKEEHIKETPSPSKIFGIFEFEDLLLILVLVLLIQEDVGDDFLIIMIVILLLT